MTMTKEYLMKKKRTFQWLCCLVIVAMTQVPSYAGKKKKGIDPEVFLTGAGDLAEKVKALGKIVQFTQDEGDDILAHLIEGGDLSQWGMLNAVTSFSKTVEDYDRASELEAIGGRILTLTPNQWNTVKEAA